MDFDEIKEMCIERMKPYSVEGFVESVGPIQPDLMFIGEAPGATEVETKLTFTGRAGQVLTEWIEYLGYKREDVFITSTIRSRPYKLVIEKNNKGEEITKKNNRPPTKKELIAHAPLLDYYIRTVQPTVIVTLGNTPFHRLTGSKKTISEVHGKILYQKLQCLKSMKTNEWTKTEKEYYIMPTFHPASIFYNRSLQKSVYSDLNQLKDFFNRK